MELSLGARLKHAWNVFLNRDPTDGVQYSPGGGYSFRLDRPRLTRGNERSIINSIYSRIAIDVASAHIMHVKLDENGRYLSTVDSELNNRLTLEANIDQTAKAFMIDAVISMLDEGCVALVPVETQFEPKSSIVDILSMRTGRIVTWYPEHVTVDVYNEHTGNREEVLLPKKMVAIVENPFYTVMNESNSTLQRLIRKLNLLDVVDEQSSSGKLDLIIQLPYAIKSEQRRKQAEMRRQEIEDQLRNTKYGIAYTDGTERITQLNRPAENNLMKQIEYLTDMLYSQLGITQGILDGTANEAAVQYYHNRIINTILSAIVDEMKRKFLSKTARKQNQSIMYFADPFRLVTISDLAESADKLTRNEIMTSNEIRQIIGLKPSDDPRADELRNKNLNAKNEPETTTTEGENQNGKL